MRPPSDMPRPARPPRRRRLPTGRGRVVLVVALVVLFVLATSLRGMAGFYTDYLWFESLGLTEVWRGVLGAKVSLVAIFTLAFFVLTWVNLTVAERLSGRAVRFGGSNEDELVLRYRELVGRRSMAVRSGVAGLLALIAGSGTAGQWDNWILFRNHVPFGQDDATFGIDIGFYVFQLPFLRFVAGWLFSALVVILVATVVAHYLNGGIRMQASRERVSAHVKAHVSVLFAALALVKAAQYLLDRYELVYSSRGPVDGATYTDVNVQMKSINLLVLISLFATALFIFNIFRRGWVLPVLAVGLWGLVAILAGEAVPAYVQKFRVEPRESALEQRYVQRNMDATKAALGLEGIETRAFDADGQLTGDQLLNNADTVRNIRLWDTGELEETYQRLQGLSPFYDIGDVDVDRYTVGGRTEQVMVASRQINQSSEVLRGWESSRLVYTSGYGAVMAPANAKTSDGQPDLVMRDIPVQSDEGYPVLEQPSIYFGEEQSGYKIVNTSRPELVLQNEDDTTRTGSYQGADGVPLDSVVRRAAFALRFGEIEPLISSSIRSDSKVLLQRDVVERVESLAPFLTFDSDPYSVILDGRLVYVIDGYTTTDRYPNAQRVDADDDLTGRDLRGQSFNYIRNPVKAVVDAYDGSVDMYVTDEVDPLLRAYRHAFPDLFTSLDEAPPGLQAHFRYPEDLFRVQTTMWGRYHVESPDQLLLGQARWTVAASPDAIDPDGQSTTTAASGPPGTAVPTTGSSGARAIEPSYQLLRLPGEDEESFTLMRPFTPASRGQLTSFMAASPDGRLVSYDMPSGELPNGPGVAAAGMQQDPRVSNLQTRLRTQGNEVSFGNALLIPIEQSILYVRPLYVTASANPNPQIKAVVVYFQRGDGETEVEVDTTLAGALQRLFGVAPETLEADPDEADIEDILDDPTAEPEEPADPPEEPGEEPSAFEGTDDELAQAVADKFDEADAAFQEGDTAAWIQAVNEAEALARQLAERRTGDDPGGGDPPSSTTAPSGGSTSSTTTTTTTAPPPTTRPSA
ncbi:MAG TPA: UPF0182 family protein [Acidimicrobiales bacterium]|nr:UPF0182 family protein [Acidimicrobiales bacterium]